MQKINLEKLVKTKYKIDEISSIVIDDFIEYQRNEMGIAAKGKILIKGEYRCALGIQDFDDCLNVDIFAPYNEISEREEINLNIEDFSYRIENEFIKFNFILHINGLIDVENKFEPFKVVDKNVVDMDILNLIKKKKSNPNSENDSFLKTMNSANFEDNIQHSNNEENETLRLDYDFSEMFKNNDYPYLDFDKEAVERKPNNIHALNENEDLNFHQEAIEREDEFDFNKEAIERDFNQEAIEREDHFDYEKEAIEKVDSNLPNSIFLDFNQEALVKDEHLKHDENSNEHHNYDHHNYSLEKEPSYNIEKQKHENEHEANLKVKNPHNYENEIIEKVPFEVEKTKKEKHGGETIIEKIIDDVIIANYEKIKDKVEKIIPNKSKHSEDRISNIFDIINQEEKYVSIWKLHVILKGENWESIAIKHNLSIDSLKNANLNVAFKEGNLLLISKK